MDKVFRSNHLLMAPIMVMILLGLILMTAILPMVKLNLKNIQFGLVDLDEESMGQTLAEKFTENAPYVLKVSQFDSLEALQKGIDEREIFGAFVLLEDF